MPLRRPRVIAALLPQVPRMHPGKTSVVSMFSPSDFRWLCGDLTRGSCCPWQCQRERKAVTVLPPAARRVTAAVRAGRLTMGRPKPPPEPVKSAVRMRGHRFSWMR